jgi:pyruvate dehydrogenase E1 component alpha subunit
VHLSNGNEIPLIEVFKRIRKTDWVFSTWRSHYHALLKGIDPKWIEDEILAGRSITLCNIDEKFYSSAIVTATLSIALGTALAIKKAGGTDKVWVFIGDMSFETGAFYEVHKYARNFDLPLWFVVEDNGVSTYTPTEATWNTKRDIPKDVIYYTYKSKYPHYGSGKWIAF